jgi:Asp-tRNA(Asn)/Glu-tRNA(Gln) amidotransferase A subunit family amidase
MDTSQYDLKSIKLPYFSGAMLRAFVSLLESPLSGMIIPQLMESAGITAFRKLQYDDAPVVYPLANTGSSESQEVNTALVLDNLSSKDSSGQGLGYKFTTIHDFTNAYHEGKVTPTHVAENVIKAINSSNGMTPPLRAIIASYADDVMQQAADSTERYAKGLPLGPFDGVPVAIKDEFDLAPYPTTVGTKFLGKEPAREDATVVARLREAGAILIGKTNMHETGIGVTGFNAHYGTVRNPYNVNHYTGGSSSGPAAAVAAGISPVALGADGGGSIRIPAAFCGVVGFKPTFGRVSEYGAAPLTWSMAHIGPLGATTADVAMTYAAIAGPDLKDKMTWHQPTPQISGWETGDIDGMTLGVFWPWFRHATADVVNICEQILEQFEAMGACIREVTIPDLEAARVAHTITIAGEIAQSMDRYYAAHRKDYSYEVRTNLALARSLTASDFILSQRVRGRVIANFNRVLSEVDIIVTPATGLPAPRILKGALPDGDSDLTTLVEIMRFATVANLTGLPSISFPVGYTPQGLPVGMQGIGRAWDEVSLFHLAQAAEKLVTRLEPQVHYDIIAM